MANSITANILQKLGARLTLEDVDGVGTNVSIDITEFDRVINLTAASTPAISKIAYDAHTLAGTPETIDLTAGVNPLEGGTIDGTGLKVQAALFYVSNATSTVTIDVTSANPIDAFGAAFSVVLAENGGAVVYAPEGGSDISATVKTIEFNGTAGDIINYVILMG